MKTLKARLAVRKERRLRAERAAQSATLMVLGGMLTIPGKR